MVANTHIFQILINIHRYQLIIIVDLDIIKNFILLFLANKKEFFT